MVEKIASDRIRSRLNVHSAKSQQTIAMLVPELASPSGQTATFLLKWTMSALAPTSEVGRAARHQEKGPGHGAGRGLSRSSGRVHPPRHPILALITPPDLV